MKPSFKKLRPFAALLAIVLIACALLKVDVKGIIAALSSLPLTLISWLIALQVLTQILLNLQWYGLCKAAGWEASFWKMLVVNSYGTVADAVTPGEKVGGEAVRVLFLNRKLGLKTGKSAMLVTMQKALSLSSLVILNLIVILAMANGIGFLRPFAVRFALLAVLVFAAVFLSLLLFKTELLALWINKINTKRKWLCAFIFWINSFAEHTKVIRQKRGNWSFQLLLSLLIWLIFPAKLVLLVLGYGRNIPVFALFAATFVSYFAGMLPLLPGGLGTFEASMGSILSAYGLGAGESAALTVVFRFVTFWFVVLASGMIILIDKLQSKSDRGIKYGIEKEKQGGMGEYCKEHTESSYTT